MTTLAVPESSTWAMMLVGFAGLGFAGYHRASSINPKILIQCYIAYYRRLFRQIGEDTKGMTRKGKLGGEARRDLHSARARLVAGPVRGAFARASDRPVRATPQSTSASPAQAEGAMGSASATAPPTTPITGTI
jgi:hypothetical protein